MTVKLLRLSAPWNNYEEFHIHVRFPATWKKSSGMSSNNCSILMRWLQITVPLTRSPQDVPDDLEMAIKIISMTSNWHLDRPEAPAFDCCLILFMNFPKFEIVFAIFFNEVFTRDPWTTLFYFPFMTTVRESLYFTWIPLAEWT